MNDSEMMAMLNHDEEGWYGLLIDRYMAYVVAVIGGIAKGALPASDIEEIAADVFFKVWRGRKQLHTSNVKAYIAKVARSTSIDKLRRKRAQLVPYEDDVLPVAFQARPEELMIAREQRQLIETGVLAFGEPDREIFIRFYFFGETVQAISDLLGLNASTTKTKLRRARAKLRDIMQERGYGCESE